AGRIRQIVQEHERWITPLANSTDNKRIRLLKATLHLELHLDTAGKYAISRLEEGNAPTGAK
ncbi:MAG: hypothetical protein WAN65_00110, partial [Candidatus Sulfotelmatobacter sp.]